MTVTRFAPSPTGLLHLGHVASALHARAVAGAEGRCLLRIEDIDAARCTAASEQALREDLDWLGLWSLGLWSGDEAVRRQSDHLAEYRAALETLRGRKLVYPCFCTRSEIARHVTEYAPDGSAVYPGMCKGIGGRRAPVEGRKPVWRLDMARALDAIGGAPAWHERGKGRIAGRAEAFGDVVLARRDNGVSYHLCVTHDDALQRVTCVTRGMDLYEATAIHRVIQALTGWPEPEYAHHPLILGADGNKLSKRDGAQGVRVLRQAGWTAEQVLDHPLVRQVIPADRSGDR